MFMVTFGSSFVDLLRMLGYTDIKHIRNDIKINNLFIKTIDEINKVV